MSWSPSFPNLKFGLSVIDGVHAYLETNASEAVQWANGDVAMDAYKRVLKNTRISREFPSLAIVEARHQPVLLEEGAGYDMVQEFLIETIVAGRAPAQLLTELRVRVVANWQMILTIPEATWLTGLAGTFTKPVIELNQAVFSGTRDPKTSGGLYEQTALQSFSLSYTQAN